MINQLLTGYGTFISDPHFLTNHLLDQQAAEQVKGVIEIIPTGAVLGIHRHEAS